MSDLDFLEDDAILVELSDKVDDLKDKVDEVEENLKIGLGCNKPDAPEVCSKIKGGKRKRKSRKKRGKGAMASRMSRKKKLSARQPKQEYAEKAIDILMNDPNFKTKDIAIKSQMIRNLALDLEDNANAKKGGRRRKSRKKRRKRKSKRKTRNKRGSHHEALLLGALALSKIFKNKKKNKTKKRRR